MENSLPVVSKNVETTLYQIDAHQGVPPLVLIACSDYPQRMRHRITVLGLCVCVSMCLCLLPC